MTVLIAAVAVGLLVVALVARVAVDDGATRAVVALLGAVVLAVVLVGAVAGFDGGGSSTSPSTDEAEPSGASDVTGGAQLRTPAIRLVATPEGRLPQVPPLVGNVADGTVLVVGVAGLDPASRMSVHQCPSGSHMPGGCRAGLPVSADENGSAVVLVDLEDRFEVAGAAPVDCADDAGCSIVVFGSTRLEVITVFGRPAPPPIRIEASPARVAPGGTVVATATGVPAGASTSFVVCRPAGGGEADCGDPVPAGRTDGAGQATAQVTVGAGRCPRGASCAIAVVIDDGGPRAFANVVLIGRSGAAYEDGRLRAGLGAAAILALVALWLLRRTDWTPVEGDPFAGVTIPEDPFAEDAETAPTR